MSLRTCVLQTQAWPWCVFLCSSAAVVSSVFKQQCLFLGAYFICLVCIQPALAAHRAEDLHVHRGESEKPPNGIFHAGPMGHLYGWAFPSVGSLKDRWPWRSREGLEKIEQAGKCKRNSLRQHSKRTKAPGEA